MILAQCGSCENQLKFPDDWIGKLIQCPNCGSMVELPAIAVAKPIRNSEKRIDVRPREITTESLIDIDVSNEQQTPKKNHGDCENDANQNDANHNDEIERTDTSDEYSVVSPTVANSQSPQPYENGFTPLNQPTADPYTGTPINVTPVPGTSYPAPSGIEAPLGALPTFNQYQANKSVQAQPVQAQPVQAQPVQAQPVQAQPVPTKPVETAPIDVARSDAQKTSKPPLIKSGVAQKKSIEEHENRQADENPASQKEAVSTSSDTKHPPVSNKPHQSDSLTTTKDDKEEDSLTLLRDSPKSKLHDSGLLDGDQADDTLLLEKRPADDPATATPNTNTSRSQASEKPEKNFTKEAAEQKPNEPVLAAKRIQPQKEKPAENQGAAVPLDSIVKAPPNSKKEFAGQPVQPQPVQPQPVQTQPVQTQPVQTQPVQTQPVQTQPVQATATPVQNDAGNDALPAIAKAVPIATASPPVIPAQEIAATTPVPSPHPTSPQPTNAKRSQLDKKPKFGEKKTIKLSPGAKKAVLYGSIGTALVVAVLLSLVFIQKMITSGPVRTFEAYKIAVKNNDFSALYDVVDSATRDTFDNYAEAKSKETPVDYSLRGKDKFVAVATKRFESTDAIKQKTIDSKLQLIEKATIVSESVNRNRASVQVRFEENATESITFEKVDGDWKIGVPTFSLLFIEY
jgi:hypothetical protein